MQVKRQWGRGLFTVRTLVLQPEARRMSPARKRLVHVIADEQVEQAVLVEVCNHRHLAARAVPSGTGRLPCALTANDDAAHPPIYGIDGLVGRLLVPRFRLLDRAVWERALFERRAVASQRALTAAHGAKHFLTPIVVQIGNHCLVVVRLWNTVHLGAKEVLCAELVAAGGVGAVKAVVIQGAILI